jgi:hypothetical protein
MAARVPGDTYRLPPQPEEPQACRHGKWQHVHIVLIDEQ